MSFTKTYTVKDEHIDVQNIMDGLYYPFYMEWCRHDFIREELGFDFEEQAHKGVNMVLSEYSLKFVRSLKSGDEFTVSCELFGDAKGLPRLHFKQTITCKGKVMTIGVFTGTCISAGGRPYLPEGILEQIAGRPVLEP